MSERPPDPPCRPSAAAYRRAAAAGLDLDELRGSDPQRFRMFSAEEVCLTSVEIVERVGEAFFALFPERDLFQLPDAVPGRVRLLAFPPLDRDEFARWDERLAALSGGWPDLPVYHRSVEDWRGLHRELALPVPPGAWRGQPAVVGPFAAEVEAADFGRDAVTGTSLGYDVFPLEDGWICDLFLADDPDLFSR